MAKRSIKNVARCRESRTAESQETKLGWSNKTVKYKPPTYLFHYMRITEKDPCRGGCILNCFMWSPLPCLFTFCHFPISIPC